MKIQPKSRRLSAAEQAQLREEKMRLYSFRLSVLFALATVLYFIIKLVFL